EERQERRENHRHRSRAFHHGAILRATRSIAFAVRVVNVRVSTAETRPRRVSYLFDAFFEALGARFEALGAFAGFGFGAFLGFGLAFALFGVGAACGLVPAPPPAGCPSANAADGARRAIARGNTRESFMEVLSRASTPRSADRVCRAG